jgi:hypothetical protein
MTATLMLLRTSAGWGLYDEQDRAIFEADGAQARRRCLERAVELGAVRVRAGEQAHRDRARR